MALKKQVVYNGKTVLAEDIDFKPISILDRTLFYTLADGTTLKAIFGVAAVYKVENEMDAAGNPIYSIELSQSYTTFPPEKKKESVKQ